MKPARLVIPLAFALAAAGLIRQRLCRARPLRPSLLASSATPTSTTTPPRRTPLAGFDRHADGSLTPIPGSPFPAGGAGLGAGLPSQGAIQLSSDGRYLLAVDAASNQISVLRLGHRGVPELVGSPVSSGGEEPLSIAVSGDLVYVANSWQRTKRHGLPTGLERRSGAACELDCRAARRLGSR